MTLLKQKILCTIAHSLFKSSRVLNLSHPLSTPLDISYPPLEIVFQGGGKERKSAEKGHYGLTTKIALRKKMEFAIFCRDGELYPKALHLLFMLWIFCKALLEGSLTALLGNLANTRADQSHSFTQLDFLQLKYFSLLPLALPKMSAEFPLTLPLVNLLLSLGSV